MKNTDGLNKQTKTKSHETLEFENRKTVESVFLITLELKDERMLGLTSLEVYNFFVKRDEKKPTFNYVLMVMWKKMVKGLILYILKTKLEKAMLLTPMKLKDSD